MNLEPYIIRHLSDHPSMQPQDLLKLCFQAAFGAEHLLGDLSLARGWLERELNEVEAENIPLCENISDELCRVNLAAWKHRGLPADRLFELFAASAQIADGGEEIFAQSLVAARRVIGQGLAGFSADQWQTFLDEYRERGIHAVHHSPQYREKEKPSYRIVKRELLDGMEI